MRCHICNPTLPHPPTENRTGSHTQMLMQLQSPSYPGARTHTPLKTMNAAEAIMAPLPTMTQLHKDTGRKQPHEYTYKIQVTQCNRAKMGRAQQECKDHFLTNKTKSHIHTQTQKDTHIGHATTIEFTHTLLLRKVTRRSTAIITRTTHPDPQLGRKRSHHRTHTDRESTPSRTVTTSHAHKPVRAPLP